LSDTLKFCSICICHTMISYYGGLLYFAVNIPLS
jgi:hypothetical protein